MKIQKLASAIATRSCSCRVRSVSTILIMLAASVAQAAALTNPTIINGSNAFNGVPFNDNTNGYSALNIFDKNDGTEYASATQGANTYLDFDFGSLQRIGTLEHQNRPVDVITSSQLILSQDATFGNFDDVVQSFTHPAHVSSSPLPNYFSFPAVLARYARWDVTGVSGCCDNNGAKEMAFHSESWTRIANPTVTNGSNAFNGVPFNNNANGYMAANVFDTGYDTAYSSNGQGAVSQPLTTNVLNGTWLDFDFGSAQAFDGFAHYNRGSLDSIATSRLIFSNDATFDTTDSIVVLTHTNQSTNDVFAFSRQTARYVRWEVTQSGAGSTGNLGARDMGFLQQLTPQYRQQLPNPTIIGGSNAFNGLPFDDPGSGYRASYVFDGNLATEYASTSNGANTFLDFDFGSITKITGFDHTQRFDNGDAAWTANLIFSNTSDFSSVLATIRIDHNRLGGEVTSTNFPAVWARYVRWDVTQVPPTGFFNTGAKEIRFFTAVPEPGAGILACLGLLAVCRFAKRR